MFFHSYSYFFFSSFYFNPRITRGILCYFPLVISTFCHILMKLLIYSTSKAQTGQIKKKKKEKEKRRKKRNRMRKNCLFYDVWTWLISIKFFFGSFCLCVPISSTSSSSPSLFTLTSFEVTDELMKSAKKYGDQKEINIE